jgi:hypothetical protein
MAEPIQESDQLEILSASIRNNWQDFTNRRNKVSGDSPTNSRNAATRATRN